MARPVIALVTDFGLADHYVGTMKGVMLGICPEATLVDISHDIPAHDVLAGALELAAAYPYFPANTVFLVVIDPGVGSPRRAIGARIAGHRFVAPDNGVLSLVLERAGDERPQIVELTAERYRRASASRTFEGRDRFAPAAAWLASGVELADLGPSVQNLERLVVPSPCVSADGIDGAVLRVDRFGNLISNIERVQADRLIRGGAVIIRICGRALPGIVSTYDAAAPGEVCALFSSSDHLEIAANRASAAAVLGATRGTPIRVERAGSPHT